MTADERREMQIARVGAFAETLEAFENSFESVIEFAALRAEVGDSAPLAMVLQRIDKLIAFYNERAACLPMGPPMAQA